MTDTTCMEKLSLSENAIKVLEKDTLKEIKKATAQKHRLICSDVLQAVSQQEI